MHNHVKYNLLNLIKEGEYERVKGILQGSFPYNATDASGATLLHYSVRYNNINVIKHLRDKGCNINIQDLNGNTPLMIAVMGNHDVAMIILLAAGADVLKLNNEKKSALHMLNERYTILSTIKYRTIVLFVQVLRAQCSSSREVAKKLMDANSPLYLAVLLNDVELIKHMLEHDAKLIDSVSPANKLTALHIAVFLNDLKIVNLLLKYGADVNALDILNVSPISNLYKKYPEHSRQKIKILKMLLDRGALMTTCTTFSGDFQVGHALTKGNNEAIRVLIESGLDFNAESSSSVKTAIHYLACNANPGVAEVLKLHMDKFDINTRDKFGQTPLFMATYAGNVSMVKFFLENGAKTDIPHEFGATALHFAYEREKSGFEKQFRQCGEMLLQYDADPQSVIVDQHGERSTVFDAALERGDLNRIKPVVAHVAMLEKRGTFITETTRAKINSHRLLKNYFERCQRLLKEKISERVVLFDLLTVNEKRMARYLNNKNIVQKVQDKRYRQKMSNYPYYLNILDRRYVEGNRYKILKSKAATIFSEIFRNHIDETHIIVDNITDYLDDQSLQQLCELSRSTDKKFKKVL